MANKSTQTKNKNNSLVPVPVGNMKILMPEDEKKQLLLIFAPTPKQFIKQREGRGGKIFDYVETSYVTARLNATFLCDWDIEIIEEKIFKEISQIATKVKLTARFIGGRTITRTAWGGSDIKMKGNKIIDIADDLKSSESDALKKAASMIGICWDVYSGILKEGEGQNSVIGDEQIEDDIPDDIADMASNPEEGAEEAKKIAEWVKSYLETQAIDYGDFKQFLIDTKWKPSRHFVGKSFGNLSLSAGNLKDLNYLKVNIDTCIEKYLSKRMKTIENSTLSEEPPD